MPSVSQWLTRSFGLAAKWASSHSRYHAVQFWAAIPDVIVLPLTFCPVTEVEFSPYKDGALIGSTLSQYRALGMDDTARTKEAPLSPHGIGLGIGPNSASAQAAAVSRVSSWKGPATSCTAKGSRSSPSPLGRVMDGNPKSDHGAWK